MSLIFKKKIKNKKGFTVIELLIIIIIVGLLASLILLAIGSARRKARDSAFKSVAKSVQTEMISCCLRGDGYAYLYNTPNLPICNGGENYPDEESIGLISFPSGSTGNCINGDFRKIITPGEGNSGNCTEALITLRGITFSGCD